MAANTPIPRGAYEHLMRSFRSDAQRKQFLEQMQSKADAEKMVGRHNIGPDTSRRADPNLISASLAGAPVAGALAMLGRGAAPMIKKVAPTAGRAIVQGSMHPAALAAGAGIGGGLEYALNDKATAGDVAGMAALGAFDVANPVASIGAQVLGYSPEGQAMPFHSWMKYLKNARGELGDTALYVNPTASELTELRKASRLDAFTNDAVPTVRLMRDMTVPDTTYGWDGTKLLHQDVANHLRRPINEMQGYTVYPEENPLMRLESLRSLQRKAGGGAIKRIGKRAMSAFDDLRPSTVAPQGALSVVKNKGGNWLAGSVEDALSGLKRHHLSMYGLPIEQGVDGGGRPLSVEQIARMRQEGVRYMDPETGEIAGEAPALNQWIEGPLTKYVKTRMASPDDEVRKLAEQGVLHFEPRGIFDTAPVMDRVVARRLMSGNPATERAITPLSEDWERYADAAVLPQEAQELPSGLVKNNPWLSKLRPTETVHQIDPDWLGHRSQESLGFSHLIDELSNALNPQSGLPSHLQLSPDAVKQMSMEKAVRRVADINAHRAAVQAAANAELANKAMVVREYADEAIPNPKGLRWVELKKAEQLPEGWRTGEELGSPHLIGPDGMLQPGVDPRHTELERQLKYEGDTMGHCVGGYCPDVLEGRSRIFSLRDAKGEPHVTVEVAPGKKLTEDDLPDSVRDQLADFDGTQEEFEALVQKSLAGQEIKSRIVQIKGKQNKAPNPEYLPFVQDFVRNNPLGGSWGDVGDLQNTGLYNTLRTLTPAELKQLEGSQMAPYMTMDEIKKLREGKSWTPIDTDPEFASGGPVRKHTPTNDFQGIIAAIEKELA